MISTDSTIPLTRRGLLAGGAAGLAGVAAAFHAVEGQAQEPATTQAFPDDKRSSRGFRVAAGEDRSPEHRKLFGDRGVPLDFKVSTRDSGGGMFIVEHTDVRKSGPARHIHHDQEEWFYVVKGQYIVEVGGERFALGPGDSALGPEGPACVGLRRGRRGHAPPRLPAGRQDGSLLQQDRDHDEVPAARGGREDVPRIWIAAHRPTPDHRLMDRGRGESPRVEEARREGTAFGHHRAKLAYIARPTRWDFSGGTAWPPGSRARPSRRTAGGGPTRRPGRGGRRAWRNRSGRSRPRGRPPARPIAARACGPSTYSSPCGGPSSPARVRSGRSAPGIRPSPRCSPSSMLTSKRSCKPRQTPRQGLPERTASTNASPSPVRRSSAIASANAPTPAGSPSRRGGPRRGPT